METIKLNNGVEMPVEGLGTFLMEPDDAQAAVESALEQASRRRCSALSFPWFGLQSSSIQ